MTREEIFLETESPILIKTRQHVRQGSRSTTSTGTRIFGETIEHIECFAAIRTMPTISQNNQLSPSRSSNCFFPCAKHRKHGARPLRGGSFIFTQHFRVYEPSAAEQSTPNFSIDGFPLLLLIFPSF